MVNSLGLPVCGALYFVAQTVLQQSIEKLGYEFSHHLYEQDDHARLEKSLRLTTSVFYPLGLALLTSLLAVRFFARWILVMALSWGTSFVFMYLDPPAHYSTFMRVDWVSVTSSFLALSVGGVAVCAFFHPSQGMNSSKYPTLFTSCKRVMQRHDQSQVKSSHRFLLAVLTYLAMDVFGRFVLEPLILHVYYGVDTIPHEYHIYHIDMALTKVVKAVSITFVVFCVSCCWTVSNFSLIAMLSSTMFVFGGLFPALQSYRMPKQLIIAQLFIFAVSHLLYVFMVVKLFHIGSFKFGMSGELGPLEAEAQTPSKVGGHVSSSQNVRHRNRG